MRSANFIEETTTSIAGASGDGDVTLTAIAGVPRLSTAFGTRATMIRYVMEDTVGKRFETGLGLVEGNVLTRVRPQVTWDGTTYDDSTPAPIAFGAAPAVGNIKIRLAATAESVATTRPGVNRTVLGADSFWQEYPLTAERRSNTNFGAAGITLNTNYYWCYNLDRAGLLTGIGTVVWTPQPGALLKLALYSIGRSGLPERKIVDFNPIDISTSSSKANTTTNLWIPAGPMWLTPGWYAIGGIVNVSGVQLAASSPSGTVGSTPFGRVGGYGDGMMIRSSGDYAAGLPEVPTFSGAILESGHINTGGVWIGLRVDQ